MCILYTGVNSKKKDVQGNHEKLSRVLFCTDTAGSPVIYGGHKHTMKEWCRLCSGKFYIFCELYIRNKLNIRNMYIRNKNVL